MVRAWRRQRDDSKTAFPWGPAASSARGSSYSYTTISRLGVGGGRGVGGIGGGSVGEDGVEVRRRTER